ncbi:DUF1648 domain-containing protein [Microbacterium sp. NPDC076768]|uniref:DUF1648 domain-containing protein n=1 Tax=Microbacterium sp. NPDC076768 TaxID=3154858 RepID=UPI00343F5215
MNNPVGRARATFVWVGGVIPLALLLASALVVIIWLPELPDPVATHWSDDGVDGFGPSWTYLVILGGIAAMVLAFALLAWFAHRLPQNGRAAPAADAGNSQWSTSAKLLGAVNLGLAAMMSLVCLASAGSQRGLADAADAPDIGLAVLVGFALLIAGTVLGWILQPRTPLPESHRTVAPAAPHTTSTSTSGRMVWTGTATIARSGRYVLGGCVLVLVALTIIILMTDDGGLAAVVIMCASCAIVIGSLVAASTFRVRISPAGLTVRSRVGWPKVEIPADDVESVRVIEVDPFGEFGGWGLRYGLDGRYAVVLRRGEALEVTRTAGRRFVVTVDDAETAAATLALAIQKSR